MCLYPKLIRNKRYLGYNVSPKDAKICTDDRKLYVPIGCGNCIECRRQKAREWQVRLCEEIKVWKYKYFVTFTFSCEELEKLANEFPNKKHNVNLIAGIAVRRFLERYRKHNKHSLKHWFITELGHTNTERIHLHGIIFTDNELDNDSLQKYWKYGITYMGEYCTNKTINYIVKYVTKIDPDHKTYKADIFTSAGIGSNYITNITRRIHKYNGTQTNQSYILPNGQRISLPIYYRNKLWTQEERDKIWTHTLDRDTRYIRGIEIQEFSKNYQKYIDILKEQQNTNICMGYGDRSNTWKEEDYSVSLKMLNKCSK